MRTLAAFACGPLYAAGRPEEKTQQRAGGRRREGINVAGAIYAVCADGYPVCVSGGIRAHTRAVSLPGELFSRVTTLTGVLSRDEENLTALLARTGRGITYRGALVQICRKLQAVSRMLVSSLTVQRNCVVDNVQEHRR